MVSYEKTVSYEQDGKLRTRWYVTNKMVSYEQDGKLRTRRYVTNKTANYEDYYPAYLPNTNTRRNIKATNTHFIQRTHGLDRCTVAIL